MRPVEPCFSVYRRPGIGALPVPHARSAGMSALRSSAADGKRSCGAIARQRWSTASNAAWFGKPRGKW